MCIPISLNICTVSMNQIHTLVFVYTCSWHISEYVYLPVYVLVFHLHIMIVCWCVHVCVGAREWEC